MKTKRSRYKKPHEIEISKTMNLKDVEGLLIESEGGESPLLNALFMKGETVVSIAMDRAKGSPYRIIGANLGISHQRVSQIYLHTIIPFYKRFFK